jgi:hypothetical protein
MANEITAVNKLYIYLLGIVSFDSEQLRNLYEESFEQAKQMEKEQMKSAHYDGQRTTSDCGADKEFSEEYYNETYGE